jgi:DNA-binding GntR family transcriptional regulator
VLALDTGESVVRRRRLILENGHPVEVATSYYPASWAAGTPLAATRRIPGGAVTLLATLGLTPGAAYDEWVRLETASDDLANLLAVAPGSPILTVERLLTSAGDVPYEFMEMSLKPGRELHYRIPDGA